MNDQPQVDNPPGVGLGLPGEKVKNPFLLDSKQPGPETGSTPVNLKDFAEQQTTVPTIEQGKEGDSLEQVLGKEVLSEEEKAKLGISNNLVRFSVGLENVQDLINDLENALKISKLTFSTY